MTVTETFCDRFESVASRNAERTAIERDGTEIWTYGKLLQRANAVAAGLANSRIARGAVVAISHPKSPEYISALIGTWRAGCVALPLPPELPSDRRLQYLERTKAAAIVGHNDLTDRVAIIDPAESFLEPVPCRLPNIDDLAYIIFTSGSTGRPKAVAVHHRGLLPMLDAQIDAFKLNHETRSLLYLSLAFDASLSDIGTALLAGGTLVIESKADELSVPKLFDQINRRRVSYADLPPAIMTLAARQRVRPPKCLETVVIGGEVCDAKAVEYWAQKLRLVNVYGPTEATVCTSLSVCEARNWIPGSIGRPIGQARYRVEPLDESDSTDGELWIGGNALASGYYDDPGLTEQKFVTRDAQRWYRTGDRIRVTEDGEFVFQGRIDRQFKLMGRLIEPAEVESILRQMPEIQAAVVIPGCTAENDAADSTVRYIVAVIQPMNAVVIDERLLRDTLLAQLPAWMVPQQFVLMESLPLTSSGKPDFAAVRKLAAATAVSSNTSAPPCSPYAQTLKNVWEATFGKSVEWDDDFHLIGGDSMIALQLIAGAEAAGVSLSVQTLLQCRTIRQCLEHPGATEMMPSSQLQQEIDRCKNRLPNARPAEPLPKQRCLLITGATGFLGTWVLQALIQRNLSVICLVRASDKLHGLSRINASRQRFGRKNLEPLRVKDVQVLCGDIAQPRWGLRMSEWDQVAAEVTDVVHLAAEVHLLKNFSQLRSVNLDAVGQVVEFCRHGMQKWLHFASTLSVFVASDREDQCFFESDRLVAATNLFGGYGQTKWAAEKLLWETMGEERLSVHRLGLLTGDSSHGIGPSSDQLSLFTRGLAELGHYPESCDSLSFDVTPVDDAAEAMTQLIDARAGGAFHICGKQAITFDRWIRAIRDVGVPLRKVTWDEFRFSVRRHLGNFADSPVAAALLSLCRRLSEPRGRADYRDLDLFLATNVRFDTSRTDKATVAGHTGFRGSVDDQLLQKMADNMLAQSASELT